MKRNAQYCLLAVLIFVCTVGIGAGTYCYFYYPFWTHIETTGLRHLTEYTSPNMRGYRGRQILIHRDFLLPIQRLDKYARNSGVEILVVQSYRHPKALLRGEKVPPAQYSNHLAGHAVDMNIRCGTALFEFADLKKASLPTLPAPVQNVVQQIRNDQQLRWGGDFEEEDPIHVDDGLNLRSRQEWQEHSEGCVRDMESARSKWRRWLHL